MKQQRELEVKSLKKLHDLTESDFIEIAKLIDNNFIGNAKIVVDGNSLSKVLVTGHTDGKQCINCQVKFDMTGFKLRGVYIQNEDLETDGAFRHVMPPTLKKVIDYMKSKNFDV